MTKKYHIRETDRADIAPEETLADALSQYSTLEMPIGRGVFKIFYILAIIMTGFLFAKSFDLQVISGKHYSSIANRTSSLQYSVPALRGIIYDVNGKPLVENVPIFDLVAIHSDLPKTTEGIDNVIWELEPILSMSRDDLGRLFGANKNSASFIVKRYLSKEEVAKIKVFSPQGLYIVDNFQRYYVNGSAFAPVLGYTAKVNETDLEQDDYYLLTDRIGRLGVESMYEKFLRGEHRQIALNSKTSDLTVTKPGHDLTLYLDEKIQTQLFRVMNNVLNASGLKRGAAIVQNPNTGAVLGLVSFPAFDANIFENYFAEENAKKISKILEDKNKPLFNRVISGRYSPGSTIKPLLAFAGLKEGVVKPDTTVFANGSISVPSKYDPNVIYTFRDWKVHGLTDLKKSIADSVDIYYYALGGGFGNIHGLGVDKIIQYYKNYWIDRALGIDLAGEVNGFVPTVKWKQSAKGEEWFVGDTYNISIGQGDLLVTPLWLNVYNSALANGGKLMRPFVVKEIKNADGELIYKNDPEVLVTAPYDDKLMTVVKEGMRQTVLSGTATLLQDLPQPVAAKTGTAEISNRGLNSLLIVFGPYENPMVAMTILIENVQGQGLAVRVAHDFLLWYFSQHNYPQL